MRTLFNGGSRGFLIPFDKSLSIFFVVKEIWVVEIFKGCHLTSLGWKWWEGFTNFLTANGIAFFFLGEHRIKAIVAGRFGAVQPERRMLVGATKSPQSSGEAPPGRDGGEWNNVRNDHQGGGVGGS